MTAVFDSVFNVAIFCLFCQCLFTNTEVKFIYSGCMSDPLSDI